jgi:integrase
LAQELLSARKAACQALLKQWGSIWSIYCDENDDRFCEAGNRRQVQIQLGHASPATTANMYADISFEDMQNGVTGLYQKIIGIL